MQFKKGQKRKQINNSAANKTYVIFRGKRTGVFNKPWSEVKRCIGNYSNPDVKVYNSEREAYADWDRHVRQRSLSTNPSKPTENALFINSCSSSAIGDCMFQIWDLAADKPVYTSPIYQDSSVNVIDFIGIVSALQLCQSAGYAYDIYSENTYSIAWVRRRLASTRINPTTKNSLAFERLSDANKWLASAPVTNSVRLWHTEVWERPCEVLRL